MLRILVLDLCFWPTHRRLNKKTIEILSSFSDVTATSYHGYYDSIAGREHIEIVEVDAREPKKNKLTQRLVYVYNLLAAWRALGKREDFDGVLVTGFELISFALFPLFFRKTGPVYLQYHRQLDELDSRVKRFFLNRYKNRVHHVFLEESFAEHFRKVVSVKQGRIHVVHHPVLDTVNEESSDKGPVLGISSSNDETFIKGIVEREKAQNCLEKLNVHLLLRSSQVEYHGRFLTVDYQFLDSREYKELFDSAAAVLVLPEREEFRHRVSGLIFEAVSSKKKVLGFDIEAMKIMNRIAPSMYWLLGQGDDFFPRLRECLEGRIQAEDYERVKRRHGDGTIAMEYRRLFCRKERKHKWHT